MRGVRRLTRHLARCIVLAEVRRGDPRRGGDGRRRSASSSREANTRTQAENSAADKIGDRAEPHRRPAHVARRLHRRCRSPDRGGPRRHHTGGDAGDAPGRCSGARTRRTSSGLWRPDGAVVAVQGSTLLSSGIRSLRRSSVAVVGGAHDGRRRPSGDAWLVDASPLRGQRRDGVRRPSAERVVHHRDRPQHRNRRGSRRHPPASDDGRYALGGNVGGATSLPATRRSTLRNAIAASRCPRVVSLDSHTSSPSRRRRSAPVFTLARDDAVHRGRPSAWQSILLLLAVILVAMLFIVVVVQIDLRRPLQRLDAAVAALGSGDFDAPVHTGSVDEVGRLGASFEAMRLQVRSTMRATATRAVGRDGAQPRAATRDGARQRL